MRPLDWILMILIYPAYMISGGMLFYDIITGTGGLEELLLIPVFLLFSVISIFSPVKVNRLDLPRYVWGFLLWLFLTATTFLTLWSYNFLRNRSPEVLTAKFFMEQGVNIYLRENGTYKAINNDMLSTSVSYGSYEIQDTLLILNSGLLNRDLRVGSARIRDTLILSPDSSGLLFKLDRTWRGLDSEKMRIEKDELFQSPR